MPTAPRTVSLTYHIPHERLRHRYDAGSETAGQDARKHQCRQTRDRRAQQRPHAKAEHDDAQQPQASHGVAQRAANRLQGAVGNKIRGQHDRRGGRRHGERLRDRREGG